jgi:GDP-mannose 6-dehydrogenase
MTSSPLTITVFGLGYVGSVSAACLADIGHNVRGVDRDRFKVERIQAGQTPFFEPGLPELIERNVTAKRLQAFTSTEEGLRGADVALLCVGTPSERNGNLGLDQLRRVVADIAVLAENHGKPLIVAVRSTVFPGTCEEVVIPQLQHLKHVSVVSNPEFLREGVAVKDFLEPSLLVVGGTDPAAVAKVAGIYDGLPVKGNLVTLRTAEMIKYSCNAFHALKVAFANEIGSLCKPLGVPEQEVMATLCQDVKLNASAAYLRPGFAFGGSCLPKDLRALTYRANRLDLKLPLLDNVLPSNDAHLRRAVQALLDLPESEPIGIFGLSFKENTDDLRESPVVTLLESLIGRGRHVHVYDPHIQIGDIYGSNQAYVLNAIPHIGRLLAPSLDEMLKQSKHVVVTQKPSAEVRTAIAASKLPVVDFSGWY